MIGQKGFALVLVLWMLTLLSVMAGSFALTMRRETAVIQSVTDRARAQAFAEAGIVLAQAMLLESDPADRAHADGRLYEFEYDEALIRVRILSELGKADINQVDKDVWMALLASFLADEKQRLRIVEAILDWVDADDEARPDGAETAEYQQAGLHYRPANRPFQSIEELRMVLGIDEMLYRWLEPLITIHSGQKQVDPNKASQELSAILEIGSHAEDAPAVLLGRSRPESDALSSELSDTERASLAGEEPVTIIAEAMLENGATAAIKTTVVKSSDDSTPFHRLSWDDASVGSESLFTDFEPSE